MRNNKNVIWLGVKNYPRTEYSRDN